MKDLIVCIAMGLPVVLTIWLLFYFLGSTVFLYAYLVFAILALSFIIGLAIRCWWIDK